MALRAFPSIPLSNGSGVSFRARVAEKNFGDGYTQTAADGMNAVVREFNARFKMRSKAEINTIKNWVMTT